MKLREDPTWTPSETEWGTHRRIFPDLTETIIAGYVHDQFLSKSRLFTSEDFRALAFERYRETYRVADAAPRFVCSCWFLKGFMKRSHFSLRGQHFKRRLHVTEEEIERWTLQVSQLLQNVGHDRILNCDETAWRLYFRKSDRFWKGCVNGPVMQSCDRPDRTGLNYAVNEGFHLLDTGTGVDEIDSR
jgi:hypothetical protein